MTKSEIEERLNAVLGILDGGIEIRGVQNAANLYGCYSILNEIAQSLKHYDRAKVCTTDGMEQGE